MYIYIYIWIILGHQRVAQSEISVTVFHSRQLVEAQDGGPPAYWWLDHYPHLAAKNLGMVTWMTWKYLELC